jgi:hypothetical protein
MAKSLQFCDSNWNCGPIVAIILTVSSSNSLLFWPASMRTSAQWLPREPILAQIAGNLSKLK